VSSKLQRREVTAHKISISSCGRQGQCRAGGGCVQLHLLCLLAIHAHTAEPRLRMVFTVGSCSAGAWSGSMIPICQ
jgi:hypothetical protein